MLNNRVYKLFKIQLRNNKQIHKMEREIMSPHKSGRYEVDKGKFLVVVAVAAKFFDIY